MEKLLEKCRSVDLDEGIDNWLKGAAVGAVLATAPGIKASVPAPVPAQTISAVVDKAKPSSVKNIKDVFGAEYDVIVAAAKRNDLAKADYKILFAIRKAENGKKGREFGILHPKCEEQMRKDPKNTLSIQAGWCAATIKNNRVRWEKLGSKGDFIEHLSKIYAPVGASNDPTGLNENWFKNVKHWISYIETLRSS